MSKNLIPAERIEGMILQLRGQKVMLDLDLADPGPGCLAGSGGQRDACPGTGGVAGGA